jgi:hypothetical protein
MEQLPLQGRNSPSWWTWMPSEFSLPQKQQVSFVDVE